MKEETRIAMIIEGIVLGILLGVLWVIETINGLKDVIDLENEHEDSYDPRRAE